MVLSPTRSKAHQRDFSRWLFFPRLQQRNPFVSESERACQYYFETGHFLIAHFTRIGGKTITATPQLTPAEFFSRMGHLAILSLSFTLSFMELSCLLPVSGLTLLTVARPSSRQSGPDSWMPAGPEPNEWVPSDMAYLDWAGPCPSDRGPRSARARTISSEEFWKSISERQQNAVRCARR